MEKLNIDNEASNSRTETESIGDDERGLYDFLFDWKQYETGPQSSD